MKSLYVNEGNIHQMWWLGVRVTCGNESHNDKNEMER